MHGSPSGVDGRWPIQTFTCVHAAGLRDSPGTPVPRKVAQHPGSSPVRCGFQPRQLHLTSQPQPLRRHHTRHLAVTRHHRVARRDPGIGDHRVIARARSPAARDRPLRRQAACECAPARDHRLVRRDLAHRRCVPRAAGDLQCGSRSPCPAAVLAPRCHRRAAPGPRHRRRDRGTGRSPPPARANL